MPQLETQVRQRTAKLRRRIVQESSLTGLPNSVGANRGFKRQISGRTKPTCGLISS